MLPLRLRRVAGHEGRLNDTLFQPASHPCHPAQTLVFFGGDVQDYPEVMRAHRDNRHYVKWNLESTARMLGTFFPDKHILVVRPTRIEFKSFSCYDNFVPSNNAGVPDHTATHSALKHLQGLLQGVSNRLKTMATSELLTAVTAVTLPDEIDIEDLHNSSILHVSQSTTTVLNYAPKYENTHISATNITDTKVSATNITDTKVSATNITDTKVSAINIIAGNSVASTTDVDTTEAEVDVRAANITEAEAATSKADASGATTSKLIDECEKPDLDPLWWRDDIALDKTVLTLVGFSKGCVVLNQCLYEFHFTQTLTPGDVHMHRFMGRIESMYWLDGGHAGGKNTWVTSRNLLETLTRLNMNIYVHVSPYQVCDEGRPWIGREEKTFTTMLTKLGAKIKRYMHCGADKTQSLRMHFDVLDNFTRVQDGARARATTPPHSDEDAEGEDQRE